MIILDDPLKPDEAMSESGRRTVNDWFDNTLLSRLNDKNVGRIILVMQRLHEDDLVGHVLEKGDWDVVSFPSIAEQDEAWEVHNFLGKARFVRSAGSILHPARESLHTLNNLRTQLGEYNFLSQYQQSPVPVEGALIKRSWLRYYELNSLDRDNGYVVQSWDTATKAHTLADFSVCTTWLITPNGYYLLNVFRKRMEYPELKRAVEAQAFEFKPQHILIEDKSSGSQLLQDLQNDRRIPVTAYEPKNLEKLMRVVARTAQFENGFVYLPEDAPWLNEYVREITSFPNGKHDDQVDSTIQVLDRFQRRRTVWDAFVPEDEMEEDRDSYDQ